MYFSDEKGDYSRVVHSAKKHKLTVTGFIRLATMAYIDHIYIVPDRKQVAELEQILSECLNEIQTIINKKPKFLWDRGDKYDTIEKRIEKLETDLDNLFCRPILLEDLIQSAVKNKPSLRAQLLALLTA